MLTKIRTATIALTAVATLAAGAAPAVSSAMTIKKTTITAAPITTVTKKAPVAAIKSAGSAGVPGYGDAECESLLNDYNTAVHASEQGLVEGDPEYTAQNGEVANRIYNQLTSNCLTID